MTRLGQGGEEAGGKGKKTRVSKKKSPADRDGRIRTSEEQEKMPRKRLGESSRSGGGGREKGRT